MSFPGGNDLQANSPPRGAAQEIFEAHSFYIGIALGFKIHLRGKAPRRVLENFTREHRLDIKASYRRGEPRDSVMSRLVDLFFEETGK